MSTGVSPNRVVQVDINLAGKGAQTRAFGNLLILGSTPGVIDVSEGYRTYNSPDDVGADFGYVAPEYKAAVIFFSQLPQPLQVFIGFFPQVATSGILHGAVLSSAQRAMANFNAITNGSFNVQIDAINRAAQNINLTACTNLSMVAAQVTASLQPYATCSWDGSRFNIISATTGTTSSVGYASPPNVGVDLSFLLALQNTQAYPPVGGVPPEAPIAAVLRYANLSNDWYGLMLAPVTPMTILDGLNIAAFIEGASPSRIFGITSKDTINFTANNGITLSSQLKQIGYRRTFGCFSSFSPYAVAAMFGIAFTVDYLAANTTITLKFKSVYGVGAETLTASQANGLEANNLNVYLNYSNGDAMLEQGVSFDGSWLDEVIGIDWLQNYCQTGQYNLLRRVRKIPQTDAGVTQQMTQLEGDLQQGVRNGLMAPGVWNLAGFGQLQQGQTLIKGFYTYAPPVSSQTQSDRDARKPIPIQVAAKLSGAFHGGHVIININR